MYLNAILDNWKMEKTSGDLQRLHPTSKNLCFIQHKTEVKPTSSPCNKHRQQNQMLCFQTGFSPVIMVCEVSNYPVYQLGIYQTRNIASAVDFRHHYRQSN